MSQAALRRLRIAPHGADLFVDPAAGYIYPAFEGLEVNCEVKPYPRPFQVADHDHFPQALGEKTGEVKWTQEGRGFGGAVAGAGSAVVATDGENGLLLKSVFGTQTKDTGSLTTAGTTASVIKVASTALFTVGAFVGLVSAGIFYARQIRSKTGTDLTLDRALPFVPGVGAVVYASAAYTHALSGHQHLYVDAEGYDPTPAKGWRRDLYGCLGDFSLKNLSANGKLMLEFALRALDWAAPNQGVNMTAPVYPANLPAVGGFIRNTRLSIGAAALDVAEFGYELGNEIQPKASTAAKNGVASWQVVGAKQAFTFKVSAEDAEAAGLRAAWLAGTPLDILVEMTQGGPGNSFAIAAPVAQIIGFKESTLNGLDYFDVTLDIQRNAVAGVSAVTLGIL